MPGFFAGLPIPSTIEPRAYNLIFLFVQPNKVYDVNIFFKIKIFLQEIKRRGSVGFDFYCISLLKNASYLRSQKNYHNVNYSLQY